MLTEICRYPWHFAAKPFQLAGNIYYVGNTDVSAHLIDTQNGLILIDTTYPQTVYLLLESIRKLGFDPYDIKYILNIHGHYDHMGGTRALKELTNAATCIGEEDIEILTDRNELSWAPEYGADFYEQYEVDKPLKHGDTITLGNTSIECEHSPGHTDGTMSFFFVVEINNREYTAGIHGGPGINTLTSEYLQKHSLPKERREIFLDTLHRLQKRHVDIHIGAHPSQNDTFGKIGKKNESTNPFIDHRSWETFLRELNKSALVFFREDPM